MLIEKDIIELVNEIREKLNIEVARQVAMFRKNEFFEDFTEHTPLECYSMCSSYFFEEIFKKVLGVECVPYMGEYNYLTIDAVRLYGFKIGMKDIIYSPGKTLAGLCAETTDAILSEYFRIRLTSVHMNDVFITDECMKLEYRLFEATQKKNYKELWAVFDEYQYYDEKFKEILIKNGYYVAMELNEENYEIPYISVQDSKGAPFAIPLCKVSKVNGFHEVCPLSIFEILIVIKDQELNFQDVLLPSREVMLAQNNLHSKVEYSGYSAEEVKRLFELGQTGYETLLELEEELERQGYSAEDDEALRIATCGYKFQDMELDVTPKTWYSIGCPYLLEEGKYLASVNRFTRVCEDGVLVVTAEWLSEYAPWILEDSFEIAGIWRIPGIQIGEGPVIYPLGLAEKTDISSVDELRKAVESAV